MWDLFLHANTCRKPKVIEIVNTWMTILQYYNIVSRLYRLYKFDGFLSDRECDGLTRAHHRHVSEVTKHDPLICFDGVETLRKHLRDAGRNTDVSVQDFTEGKFCGIIWKSVWKYL